MTHADAGLARQQADWLHGLPDKFMGCRGDHHDWPTITPGKLPRGVKAVPVADGCFQMEITCRNCGRVRIKTTLPGGVYDRNAVYFYRDPEGYAAPKGLELSKSDYTVELYRRLAENLQAEAHHASQPAAGAGSPAAARFSSAGAR